MTNSLYIPLSSIPEHIDEVGTIVTSAFQEFSLELPRVSFEYPPSRPDSFALMDGFVVIESQERNDRCWVSLSLSTPEITEDDERHLLADVQTRNSWVFAGVVAYAFCAYAGRVIFNDSGKLDGQPTYSCESIKILLRRLTASPQSTGFSP